MKTGGTAAAPPRSSLGGQYVCRYGRIRLASRSDVALVVRPSMTISIPINAPVFFGAFFGAIVGGFIAWLTIVYFIMTRDA